MRPHISLLAFSFAALSICGCRTAPPATEAGPTPAASDGHSLSQMEADWAVLRKKYEADCIAGTPDHVRTNQPLCAQERTQMKPLGDALAAAEVKAAQKAPQVP